VPGATRSRADRWPVMMRRRVLLAGAAGIATTVAAGYHYVRPEPQEPIVPGAPAGDERVERRHSAARGRTVDFYTAVPTGHGDGRGLPVCLVLHGASKTAADFPALNLGGFLTEAVRHGAPPFVLAGATGDRLSWRPSGADDPQRMVHEEIPAWCASRGFDTSRLAAWGWSMGGYGSLLLAATFPGFVRAVAAFAPAVSRDVPDVAELRKVSIGLWCGKQDGYYYDDVRDLAGQVRPVAGGYADGRHNFGYWSRCIPDAFGFVAGELS
jgi:hypothetical protein